MSQFKTPRKVHFNAENLAEEWQRWEKFFRMYYAASELHTKPTATQIAALLNRDFGAFKDRLLRDKILFGTNDDAAQQRMLGEEDLIVKKVVNTQIN